MKNRPLAPAFPPISSASLVLALSLALAGCFGGEGDTATNTGGNGQTGGGDIKSLKAGLYVGDYAPYDTAEQGWESEFHLDADGNFRFFWILGNMPVGDIQGKWVQRDSNLQFSSMTESFLDMNSETFPPAYRIDDDTNAVRAVTDTSFIRREWTLLRQKPYWVTYTLRAIPAVKQGTYQFSKYMSDTLPDTGAVDPTQVRITLDGGGDFGYTIKPDSVIDVEFDGQWAQLGSILVTRNNRVRSWVDSLKAFDDWDTIPGSMLHRVRYVSDTAFHFWFPGNFFSAGDWGVFGRIPVPET